VSRFPAGRSAATALVLIRCCTGLDRGHSGSNRGSWDIGAVPGFREVRSRTERPRRLPGTAGPHAAEPWGGRSWGSGRHHRAYLRGPPDTSARQRYSGRLAHACDCPCEFRGPSSAERAAFTNRGIVVIPNLAVRKMALGVLSVTTMIGIFHTARLGRRRLG